MSKTKLFSRLAVGLGILASASWFVTGTFPLAAAPQLVNDAPGVTVELNAAGLLHRAPVSYPESARKHGIQGTVTLDATLDRSGNVIDARIIGGPDELRKPALQSILQWHFSNSAPGSTRQVSITFRLPEQETTPRSIQVPLQSQGQSGIAVEPPADKVKVQMAQDSIQQQLKAAAQAMDRYRLPSMAGRTLKSINILGLSDQMRSELLAKLPVREGDALGESSLQNIAAQVKEFDDHLSITLNGSAPGEARLIITAPDFAIRVPAMTAKLVRQPKPMYPPEAKAQRIQGIVKLSAIIAADGTVKNVEVINGDPLLSPAAVDAVRQWVYQPTLLNGEPVDVKTEIDVNFTLSQ